MRNESPSSMRRLPRDRTSRRAAPCLALQEGALRERQRKTPRLRIHCSTGRMTSGWTSGRGTTIRWTSSFLAAPWRAVSALPALEEIGTQRRLCEVQRVLSRITRRPSDIRGQARSQWLPSRVADAKPVSRVVDDDVGDEGKREDQQHVSPSKPCPGPDQRPRAEREVELD